MQREMMIGQLSLKLVANIESNISVKVQKCQDIGETTKSFEYEKCLETGKS